MEDTVSFSGASQDGTRKIDSEAEQNEFTRRRQNAKTIVILFIDNLLIGLSLLCADKY
jgi:hypothetical protein